MKRTLLVAHREFVATAATKGFVFGVLVMPVMLALVIYLTPRLLLTPPPKVQGEVAIIDPTGQVAAALHGYIQPERIAQRWREAAGRVQEAMPPALKGAAEGGATSATQEAPILDLASLAPGTDVETAKQPLREPGADGPAPHRRLVLVVVHADAVERAPGSTGFGSYDLYTREKLDERISDEVRRGTEDGIVAARVEHAGLDRGEVEALTRVHAARVTTVSAHGERATNQVFTAIIPMAFMLLLVMSVFMSGQYLLTTTVEEKSSRVAEVLLSAVSPMELMAGKIVGQLGVGLVVLAVYMGLGLMALVSFAVLGLLEPMLIVYLLLFFLCAYASVGGLMGAVGAAVSEMREAQALMAPITLVIMLPMMLWMPISRDPNSTLATVLSFVPLLGNFVIMLRLASATPPPLWQTGLSLMVSAGGAVASLWFASKVFRIGLLMHGRPPTLSTLIRWVRTA